MSEIQESGPRAYLFSTACERLDISVMQGYRLIEAKELETFTIGTRRYVSEDSLQQFILRRISAGRSETKQDRQAKAEKAIAGRQAARTARSTA